MIIRFSWIIIYFFFLWFFFFLIITILSFFNIFSLRNNINYLRFFCNIRLPGLPTTSPSMRILICPP